MDAKHLAALQEHLLLGEYTTQDLHDAARCAAAWAKVTSADNPQLELWDWPQGTKWYFRANGIKTASGDNPIAAVEAAPEVKP